MQLHLQSHHLHLQLVVAALCIMCSFFKYNSLHRFFNHPWGMSQRRGISKLILSQHSSAAGTRIFSLLCQETRELWVFFPWRALPWAAPSHWVNTRDAPLKTDSLFLFLSGFLVWRYVYSCLKWFYVPLLQVGMFKIHPEIPESMSLEAKAFILRCFEPDPDKRATAFDLLTDEFLTVTSRKKKNKSSFTGGFSAALLFSSLSLCIWIPINLHSVYARSSWVHVRSSKVKKNNLQYKISKG